MIEYKTIFGTLYSERTIEKGDVVRIKVETGLDCFFYVESIKNEYLELEEYEMVDVEIA